MQQDGKFTQLTGEGMTSFDFGGVTTQWLKEGIRRAFLPRKCWRVSSGSPAAKLASNNNVVAVANQRSQSFMPGISAAPTKARILSE